MALAAKDAARASALTAPPNRALQRPRRAITTRVLLSFAVVVLAFTATASFGAAAQEQSARDAEELAKGYLPVALRLGQLRAAETTLTNLIDGAPDEQDPGARLVLELLVNVRRAKFREARMVMTTDLREAGSPKTKELALALTGELDQAEAELAGEGAALRRFFTAWASHDRDGANREIVLLGAMERACDKRLRALADRLSSTMDAVGVAAQARQRRAIWLLAIFALGSLVVGALMSLRVRKVLAPLARVTERASAVAQGDLEAREPIATDDELGALSVAFEQMVAAVAREKERAVEAERLAAIGKMAAHVTHEIRNPLSSIGLNIELLEEELAAQGAKSETRGLLAAITREVSRLEQLSEEYLRLAKLPSPRLEADDLKSLLTDLVQFVLPEMERAHSSVTLAVSEPLPNVLFDEAQMRQALLNLLRNARESMPEGGAIEVRAEPEGMGVIVSVSDRGSGIGDDIRGRVFDPFFSTKGEGTGLGLAITRQIVEGHGGSVTCAARDGGGTAFRIALPIAPARTSYSVQTEARRPPA